MKFFAPIAIAIFLSVSYAGAAVLPYPADFPSAWTLRADKTCTIHGIKIRGRVYDKRTSKDSEELISIIDRNDVPRLMIETHIKHGIPTPGSLLLLDGEIKKLSPENGNSAHIKGALGVDLQELSRCMQPQ